jgi:hypothetical protein
MEERSGVGKWGCDGGCGAAGAYGSHADMLMGTITKKSQREKLKQLRGRITDTKDVTDMGLGTFDAFIVTNNSDNQIVVSDNRENSADSLQKLRADYYERSCNHDIE